MKERLNSKKGKYLKSLFFVAMFVSIAYMVGVIAEAKGIKLSYDMVKQQKTQIGVGLHRQKILLDTK